MSAVMEVKAEWRVLLEGAQGVNIDLTHDELKLKVAKLTRENACLKKLNSLPRQRMDVCGRIMGESDGNVCVRCARDLNRHLEQSYGLVS